MAHADGPDLNGGGRDPNYVYSPQELNAIAAKKAKAKHYMRKRIADLSTEEPEISSTLYVPETDAFKEKNDYAHRNYCGPAATKIILYTWVGDGVALPTMNEIGQGEQIDPSWGVYNWRVRDYLNNWLPDHVTPYNWDYVESTGSTKADLKSYILTDIDYGWGMESALWTGSEDGELMLGWETTRLNVRHISAIRGYRMSTTRFIVYYVESGQSAQGYYGSFYQQLSLTKFYKHVNAYYADPNKNNNSQVW